jgi:osmotically inducible protein OsmC
MEETIMADRTATAVWEGDLKQGGGSTQFAGGACDLPYTFRSRFEDGEGTNPEELIAAAHAACFSMALSNDLAEAGMAPKRIETKASVRIEKADEGFAITRILLETRGDVDADAETFRKHAEQAKMNCPVSKALAGTNIEVKAELA